MKKGEMRWQDWLWLCFAGAMGLMAVLAIVPGYSTIGAWMAKDAAPAWVQAVGSVLAIVASSGVAGWQMHKTQADNRSLRRREFRTKISAVFIVLGHARHAVGLCRKDLEKHKRIQAIPLNEIERVGAVIDALPMFEMPHPAALDQLNVVGQYLRFIIQEHKSTSAGSDAHRDAVLKYVKKAEDRLEKFITSTGETLIEVTKPGEAISSRLLERFNKFHGIKTETETGTETEMAKAETPSG